MFDGHDLTCVRGERIVFTGLSFHLQPGGALLVTGPNGSGKSSLLRLMAGLLRPARGDLHWNGTALAEDTDALRRHIHYLGHLDAVKPTLTVFENVAFWARFKGGDIDRAHGALDHFGLSHLADLPARLLSAGQRRRLALTRLLASPARLWLLDEPTVALDRESVAATEAAIADQCAGGGMVVVSTNAPVAVPGAKALDIGGYTASADDVFAAGDML